MLIILAMASLTTTGCRPHTTTSPPAAAMPVTAFVNLGSTPAEIDSAVKVRDDSIAAAAAARRRQVRIIIDPPLAWFEARRPLDLSGDGHADELIIRAVGSRSDSLAIRLAVVIGKDTLVLDDWQSSYELVDPPFPRDTTRAMVDSFVRARLVEVIAGVEVSIESITKETLESNAGDPCEGDLAACLRTRWGLTSIEGKDVAAELLKAPVPLISFGYGYETSKTIAYVAMLRRFVGISECC